MQLGDEALPVQADRLLQSAPSVRAFGGAQLAEAVQVQLQGDGAVPGVPLVEPEDELVARPLPQAVQSGAGPEKGGFHGVAGVGGLAAVLPKQGGQLFGGYRPAPGADEVSQQKPYHFRVAVGIAYRAILPSNGKAV